MAPAPTSDSPLEAGLHYQPHVDGLRGLAIAAVIIFHAFPTALPGGYLGVDVFFVISGYLITGILCRDVAAPATSASHALVDFYIRRVRRILPALAVVLLAVLALGYWVLVPIEYESLGRQTLAGTAFYQNFLLARHVGYFDPAASSTPLLHLWSLAVEEQFYLLWPLTLWLALRLRLRALAVIVFLGVASFGWNVLRLPGSEAAAFFLPQTRLWEILLGAAAAALVRNRSANGPALLENLGAAVGCAAVFGGAWLAERAGNPPTAWTLLPTAGTALLLCGPTGSFIHRHILSQPALIWVGLISYPLYLWHWPLLTLARIRFEAFPGATFRIAVVALSVVLAAGTYYLVERPVRRQRPSRTLAAVLMAALAAVGGLAWMVQRFQGFPDRFPPLLSAIGSYTYDGAASTRLGTYFLMGDRDETAFPHDPHEIIPGRPVLYLWGDSHAASLYTGLKHGYGDRLSIVQRTAAKTPPFMPDAFNPGNARQISQFVFNAIARDRPAEVVLDADWPNYEWRRVGDTIAALRRAGINRVIVIGPVPHWLPTLPQALFNFARRHPGAPVPEYLPVRDSVDLAPLDREMADLCKEQGADYFSALQALSVPGGYRVRTGANADSLLTFDQSHLTAHGAEYLVEHLPGFGR